MTIQRRVFVDTWAWMALGHRREPRHHEIAQLYQELRRERGNIFTSDFVLDELITLLFRREQYAEAVRFAEGIFTAAALGQVEIERVTPERFSGAWNLRKRFQDKPGISFTDVTSMYIMNELGIPQILTEDEHFVHVGMGFVLLP